METWITQHFLNPAFVLGGTALVAAPIIIHLINRLRFRRVQFAAMEFLLQSQQRNRRRILLEQLLLLLLRILIVLVIVALISRLVLDPNEMSLFRGAQSHHVVLLDDSGSMRDQTGESTAFDSALDVVRKLAAEGARRPGTQKITLLTMSQPDQPLVTQKKVEETFLGELEGRLENLDCSHQSLSLQAGLEGARNVLIEDRASIRHLHVISDFRNNNWQDQQSLSGIIRELDSADVAINLVKVVAERNQNLSITSLIGDVQVASAGVPVRLSVSVQNFGDQVAANVSLSVFQNGQKLPLAINFDKIEAGIEVQQEFDLTFDSEGRHRVDVSLPADSLLADNARFLSLEVAAVNKVLIIEGNPANGEGDYLADALAADPGITGYAPQLETPDYLRRRPLDEFQSIFLLNVSDLTADALAPLEDFVKAGGGLIWFLGNEIRPAYYITELYRDGKGLFPVRIGVVSAESQASDADGRPDTEFMDHAAFQVFLGQENPFTQLIRVYEYFPVAEDWEDDDQRREDDVRTIARLTNREPLMFESRFGEGTIITCLTSCGPMWNNWARYPSFVAMMLDMEKHVARRDRVLERRVVGESIRLSLDPNEFLPEIEIVRPDSEGNRVTRTKAVPPKNQEGDSASESTANVRLEAVFDETDTPGIYQVKLMSQNQAIVERWVTFNVPTDESELELATTELIRKQLGDNLDIQIQEAGEFSWIAGRDAGQEIRFWLLISLILLLLAEQLMGYRLSYHTR